MSSEKSFSTLTECGLRRARMANAGFKPGIEFVTILAKHSVNFFLFLNISSAQDYLPRKAALYRK
jgi:hypothetical protein